MNSVCVEEGRTVLFVSHNMAAVKSFCTTGILLNNGQITCMGTSSAAIEEYFKENKGEFSTHMEIADLKRERGAKKITITDLYFNSAMYFPSSAFAISLQLKAKQPIKENSELTMSVHIVDSYENQIYHLSTPFVGAENIPFSENGRYTFTIPNLNLKSGTYAIWLWLCMNGEEQEWITSGITLTVNEGNIYDYPNSRIVSGVVQPVFEFKVEKNE